MSCGHGIVFVRCTDLVKLRWCSILGAVVFLFATWRWWGVLKQSAKRKTYDDESKGLELGEVTSAQQEGDSMSVVPVSAVSVADSPALAADPLPTGSDDSLAPIVESISTVESAETHEQAKERLLAPRMLALAGLTGLCSGTLFGLVGISGPPIMIFVSFANISKGLTRGTTVLVLGSLLPVNIVYLLVIEKKFDSPQWWALYFPVILGSALGTALGNHIHNQPCVTDARIRKIIIVLLSVSAVMLWGGGDLSQSFMALGVLVVFVICAHLWHAHGTGSSTPTGERTVQ